MATPATHGYGPVDPAWERALDDLQDALGAIERSHFADEPFEPRPWAPPALPTALPSYLAPRARDLVARQEALLTLIAENRDRVRRQLDVTRRINQVTGSASRPPTVFFDASA